MVGITNRCKHCNSHLQGYEKCCSSCGKKVTDVDLSGSCKKCGVNTRIDTQDKFCHNCGTPMSSDVCPSCRAKIDEKSKFCKECGANVKEANGSKSKSLSCKKCGTELKKGDKFCEKCGNKV